MTLVQLQVRSQGVVNVLHEVVQPCGGETKLSCPAKVSASRTEALSMGAPCSRELNVKGIKEVCCHVNSEMMGVNDMPENIVDVSNDHLLEFVKGGKVLPLVKCQRPEKDKNHLDADSSDH
jgi:tRNA U34 2-thiouridine synthase MnmA/TrmU